MGDIQHAQPTALARRNGRHLGAGDSFDRAMGRFVAVETIL